MEIADAVSRSSAATDADDDLAAAAAGAPHSPVGTSSQSEDDLELMEIPNTLKGKKKSESKTSTNKKSPAKASAGPRAVGKSGGQTAKKIVVASKKAAVEKRKATQKVKQAKKRALALYKSL